MSFRNVVDLTPNADYENELPISLPLPEPMAPLPDSVATRIAIKDIRKRSDCYDRMDELDHDYWSIIRHNDDVFSNVNVPGYFGPSINPRQDPDVLAHIGFSPKVDELRTRIDYQRKRRRTLENIDGAINSMIERLIEAKHANLRDMINSRLEENYHTIALEVIDVDDCASDL